MNDDNTESAAPAASPRKRTAAVAAAVGVGGLVAGGLIAGAISAASADTGESGVRPGYGVQQDGYGRPAPGEGPSGRMGGDCPDGVDRGNGGGGSAQQNPAPSPEDSTFRDS